MNDSSNPAPSAFFIRNLVSVVAAVFRVTPFDIRGKRRTSRIVRARQVAMGVAIHSGRGLSLPQVGRRFGGRDHTTVLHAAKRYRAWCDELGQSPDYDDAAERAVLLAHYLGFEDAALPSIPETELLDDSVAVPAEPDADVVSQAAPLSPPLASSPHGLEPYAMPVPQPSPPPTPAAAPAAIVEGDLFGRTPLDAAGFARLPPAMQGEALRLALEYLAVTHPRLGTEARLVRVARLAGLGSDEAAALIDGKHERHRLPGESSDGGSSEKAHDVRLDIGPRVEAKPGPNGFGGFDAFATEHLRADPAGQLAVQVAYLVYRGFCPRVREAAMPLTSFGAALRQRALNAGGTRLGDIVTGLRIVE
jgi:hypothetical protein